MEKMDTTNTDTPPSPQKALVLRPNVLAKLRYRMNAVDVLQVKNVQRSSTAKELQAKYGVMFYPRSDKDSANPASAQ